MYGSKLSKYEVMVWPLQSFRRIEKTSFQLAYLRINDSPDVVESASANAHSGWASLWKAADGGIELKPNVEAMLSAYRLLLTIPTHPSYSKQPSAHAHVASSQSLDRTRLGSKEPR